VFVLLEITSRDLAVQRADRLKLSDGALVLSDQDAARFIDERGFALLAPWPKVPLPSLSAADPRPCWEGFSITDAAWRWKEVLPGQRLCAYGKFICNRGAFISWRLLPAFYALFGPADGLEEEYVAQSMTPEARTVLNIIEAEGPIDTRVLWREVGPIFAGNRKIFVQALATLQIKYIITVSGGELDGWSLHSWDLVTRQVPNGLLDHLPSAADASHTILLQLLENAVCCSTALAASILRQDRRSVKNLLQELVAAEQVTQVHVSGEATAYWLLINQTTNGVS